MRTRVLGSLFLLAACAPKPATADGSEGTTVALPEETSAGSTSTTAPTSSSTPESSSTGLEYPAQGEWVGRYGTGFGYAYFTPCGSDKAWIVADGLPGYEYCEQAPLWLRVVGTVATGHEDLGLCVLP